MRISDKELDEEEMERKVSRSEDLTLYKRVQPGDLVYNQMRAWQGAFGAAKIEGLAACRAWGVESVLVERRSQNRPQRGQFLPDLQAHSPAMGQKDGVHGVRRSQKWTAAVGLQPANPKPDRLLVSPAYVVARPGPSVLPTFVEYLLRAPAAMEEIRRRSRGITEFRLRLYWNEFKNIRIALPPLNHGG